MPTKTQLQPKNQSSQITVSGAAYSATLAHGSGSAHSMPIHTPKSAAPMPTRCRFHWFRSLLDDTVAIPAIYGLLIPLAARHFQALGEFWFFALPVCLTITLSLTRRKKRLGLLTGALFGLVSALALNAEVALRGQHLYGGDLISETACFALCGAAIGTFATGLRQGAIWLFGSNRP